MEPTKSIEHMLEKDMTVHYVESFYNFLVSTPGVKEQRIAAKMRESKGLKQVNKRLNVTFQLHFYNLKVHVEQTRVNFRSL